MLEHFAVGGAAGTHRGLHRSVRLLTFVILPLTVSAAYFGADLLINYALPSFGPGLGAIQVSLLVVVFWQVASLYQLVLQTAERVFLLISLTALSLAALVAALWLEARTGLTLVGVAWATVGGQGLYLMLLVA